MSERRSIPGRFNKLYKRLKNLKVPYRLTFFIIGIASTIWFLVRVIPKPSRASYPCMRVAAPFMSSFVIYLLSLSGSVMLLKRSRRLLTKTRYILAVGAFLGAVVLFAVSSNIFPERLLAGEQGAVPSDFPPNQPMGDELGIFPGRVVWEWDTAATDENCTNTQNDPVRGEDGYFLPQNSNQEVIDEMLENTVMKLSGMYDVKSAWDCLFTDFNFRKGVGEVTYQPGQKLFIKINQGGGGWLTDDKDLSFKVANWTERYYGMAETTPAVVISLLDQLVNVYGIAEEDIFVGDPIAHIYKHNYDQMVARFPNVVYIDRSHSDLGRTLITASSEPAIIWSDKGNVMPGAGVDYLYSEMENADYMINLATLKAHARAGITLTTKNHFGSNTRQNAAHLHDGLVCYVENDILEPARTDYGMYRVLTDIMGHDKLGGNTVLFIVEGLWGGTEAVEKPVKWSSAPFDGDWPNSIFASQDAVALESVCFDLLKTEFNNPVTDPNNIIPGRNRPWYGGVDDHLHQAADSRNWPEGITYDPEGDGTPMGSMGVHEHWNNDVDKQYSRNLGYDYGIELITPKSLVSNTINALEAETAPLIDGDPSDDCWQAAQWYHIDQTWISWGESIDSSDFFGRFKVSWSEAENLVYYLVEITDDAFVDGYEFPNQGYYNFDVLELFLDEDVSGGDHKLDENAFAYHLTVNAPEDGSSESAFHACDLGADWAVMDYANHIPGLSMKKTGNSYCYEFALGVYDDAYDHNNSEASRVALTGNKEMGMSMAYCDNDAPDGERDNFFGSVWVPREAFNDHWQNADGFGRIRLINDETSLNHAVEVTGDIEDYELLCYPNPFSDLLHVNLNLSTAYSGPASVLIYDMAGRSILHQKDIYLSGGIGYVSLEMSGESRGMYLLKVRAGKEHHSMILNKYE
ncbi:MAG: sugar-binding protein [Bacteroidota bacterium]